jgi:hypothetical protein
MGVRAARRCPPRGWEDAAVRRSDFWQRMEGFFGARYAESFAADHVLAELGHRTVREALDAGEDAKDVWRAVVVEMRVPRPLQ